MGGTDVGGGGVLAEGTGRTSSSEAVTGVGVGVGEGSKTQLEVAGKKDLEE